MTGKDLKLKRVAADLLVKDIAEAMRVSDSRVSRIENSRVITPEAQAKYLVALDTCITKSTDSTAAQ